MNNPDYCFALRNGFCEAMRDPRCPGYDVCPFYKPRSVWEREQGESAEDYFREHKHRRMCQDDHETIIRLRREGLSGTAIAEKLNLNEKSVYQLLARLKRKGVAV